jgi:hypothetical protein
MMGNKKLSEIKAQIQAASASAIGKSPKTAADRNRTVETLESLCATLEREVKKYQKSKVRRRSVKS